MEDKFPICVTKPLRASDQVIISWKQHLKDQNLGVVCKPSVYPGKVELWRELTSGEREELRLDKSEIIRGSIYPKRQKEQHDTNKQHNGK